MIQEKPRDIHTKTGETMEKQTRSQQEAAPVQKSQEVNRTFVMENLILACLKKKHNIEGLIKTR